MDSNDQNKSPEKRRYLKVVLLIAIGFTFLCGGCAGFGYYLYLEESKSPKAKLEAFVEDIKYARYGDVYDRLDQETKQSYQTPANKQKHPDKTGKDLFEELMKGSEGSDLTGRILPKISGSVQLVSQNGEEATLEIRPNLIGPTNTLIMKKEEGKWKVNLTKLKVK